MPEYEIIDKLNRLLELHLIKVQGMISRRDKRNLQLFPVDINPQEKNLNNEFNRCQGLVWEQNQ